MVCSRVKVLGFYISFDQASTLNGCFNLQLWGKPIMSLIVPWADPIDVDLVILPERQEESNEIMVLRV